MKKTSSLFLLSAKKRNYPLETDSFIGMYELTLKFMGFKSEYIEAK
jgi:hypothetical protein